MKKITSVIDKGIGRLSLVAAGVAGWIAGVVYLAGLAAVDLTALSPLALSLSVLGVIGLIMAWLGIADKI